MDHRPSSSPPVRAVHVVILAAGRGSRLGVLGDDTPKWLLRVGDRTLADRQLEGIARAAEAGAVASTSVVTGHAAAAIDAELVSRSDHAVTIVANREYAERNNWWSLLRALREMPAAQPVVVINADLLADPEQVTAFVTAAAAAEADGLLAVDLERELTDESMKVERRADGALGRIGKADIDAPVGEYVGMLMARGQALARLHAALEAFVGRPEAANEWYEGAVARTLGAGVRWEIWPMPTGGWVEIDDDTDLDAAQTLVGVP